MRLLWTTVLGLLLSGSLMAGTLVSTNVNITGDQAKAMIDALAELGLEGVQTDKKFAGGGFERVTTLVGTGLSCVANSRWNPRKAKEVKTYNCTLQANSIGE